MNVVPNWKRMKSENKVSLVSVWDKIQDICGIRGWLKEENLARVQDAHKYHAIYDAKIWGSLIEKREPEEKFVPAMIESGLGTLLIDVSASALFERGINFRCGSYREKDEEDAKRERALYDLYRNNNMRVILAEAAITAGIEGDVFFELWKPENEDQGVIIPHAGIEVFPIYRFKGGYTPQQMTECHIVYEVEEPGYDEVVFKQSYRMAGGECYVGTSYWDTKKKAPLEINPEVSTGLPFLPVYHVRNKGKLNKYFGYSDFHNAKELLAEINKALSDITDARRMNAFPIKVLKGYGIDLDALKIAPDAVWEIPEEGGAEVLSVGAEFFRAMKENLDHLIQILYWIMETPAIAMGDTANLRDTSGVALEILFNLLIKKTRRKQAYWDVLARMNADYLRMLEIFGIENFNGNYQNELVWGDIIPRSVDKDVDTALKAVTGKIWAPTRGMDYTGVEDADEELRKVAEENGRIMNPYGLAQETRVPDGIPG